MSTAKTQSSAKKARRTHKIASKSMERMIKDIITRIDKFQDSFYTQKYEDEWYVGRIADEGIEFANDIKNQLIDFVDKINTADQCSIGKINMELKEYIPPVDDYYS
jgi:hypothetical protein